MSVCQLECLPRLKTLKLKYYTLSQYTYSVSYYDTDVSDIYHAHITDHYH